MLLIPDQFYPHFPHHCSPPYYQALIPLQKFSQNFKSLRSFINSFNNSDIQTHLLLVQQIIIVPSVLGEALEQIEVRSFTVPTLSLFSQNFRLQGIVIVVMLEAFIVFIIIVPLFAFFHAFSFYLSLEKCNQIMLLINWNSFKFKINL